MSYYSNGSKSKWQRVCRHHHCQICGKHDWCLFTGPADNPEAAICARIESGKRVGVEGAGWLHRLRDDPFQVRPRTRTFKVETAPEPAIDFGAIAHECYGAMGEHRRHSLANDLGVSVDSLHRLRVGWSARHHATTWPMSDAKGEVRGVRLRGKEGRKWSIRGGREGLFLPDGLTTDCRIIICEGATDTAALLDLDFFAVGRPSCTGGVKLLVELIECDHPHEVAIIADRDVPGQRGARNLAARLVGYVAGGVRIVTPPAKDAREWVQSGADRHDIMDAIEAAPALTLSYCGRAAI